MIKPSPGLFPRPGPFKPGDRSTKFGGFWHMCRVFGGRCEVQSEIGNVLDSLPEDYVDIAWDRFEKLWDKAEQGKLRSVKPHPEMRELKTEPQPPKELADKGILPPVLFEIRLQINESAPDESRRILLRLYYAEPEEFKRMILAIHFARKPADGDPTGKQQHQIERAGRRYYEGLINDYNWGYSPN